MWIFDAFEFWKADPTFYTALPFWMVILSGVFLLMAVISLMKVAQ